MITANWSIPRPALNISDTFNLTNPIVLSIPYYDERQLFKNTLTGEYLIDKNKDGNVDYTLRNPDFSFIQFQSNLVLRYEYNPSSEIFLVWSQGLTSHGCPLPHFFDNIESQLFNTPTVNNFLVKITYRFY